MLYNFNNNLCQNGVLFLTKSFWDQQKYYSAYYNHFTTPDVPYKTYIESFELLTM